MDNELLNKIMESINAPTDHAAGDDAHQCNLTEFVGAGIGDTVGLVIANLDEHLRKSINLNKNFRSIGIVSSRTGGAPHVMSADDAVKATNTEIVSVEFCRDTKAAPATAARSFSAPRMSPTPAAPWKSCLQRWIRTSAMCMAAMPVISSCTTHPGPATHCTRPSRRPSARPSASRWEHRLLWAC